MTILASPRSSSWLLPRARNRKMSTKKKAYVVCESESAKVPETLSLWRIPKLTATRKHLTRCSGHIGCAVWSVRLVLQPNENIVCNISYFLIFKICEGKSYKDEMHRQIQSASDCVAPAEIFQGGAPMHRYRSIGFIVHLDSRKTIGKSC